MSLAASNRLTNDALAATRPVLSDDAQLVQRFCAGDGSALGPLIEKYQDRVYNTCLRICGRHEDAADVTQDAFVRVFETLGSFAGQSSFYTWLFRIAVNLAISHKRKMATRRAASLDATHGHADNERGGALIDSLAADDGSPVQSLAHRERAARVTTALAELDDDQRAILVLRDVEDFDYDEVAEILELPVGTVKSRLHRARLALRDKLRTEAD